MMAYESVIGAGGRLAAEIYGLTAAYEGLVEVLDRFHEEKEGLLQEVGYQEALDALTAALEELRDTAGQRYNAWLEKVQRQEALDALESEKARQLRGDKDLDKVDPATGKSNLAWIESQIEATLRKDPAVKRTRDEATRALEEYRAAEMRYDLAQANLSTARHRARLVAAALIFLASDTAALGPVGISGRRPTAGGGVATDTTTGAGSAFELLEEE